jgi:hypothetical protein
LVRCDGCDTFTVESSRFYKGILQSVAGWTFRLELIPQLAELNTCHYSWQLLYYTKTAFLVFFAFISVSYLDANALL